MPRLVARALPSIRARCSPSPPPTALFARRLSPYSFENPRSLGTISFRAAMASSSTQKRHKVAVIGSGNWGSAIAKIVAENAKEHPDVFEPEVQMWVFEEQYELPKDSRHYDASSPLCQGRQPLSKLVNAFHENVKYLPGIALPHNLRANPSIRAAVQGATILIFNLPHQFIQKTCEDLAGHIVPYARGISCIKGVSVTSNNISLFSDVIGQKLGIYCGALSGANIATEVAQEKWCETTIAYDPPATDSHARPAGSGSSSSSLTPMPAEFPELDHPTLKKLFHRPYFHVRLVADVAAVSLCGALKNVVALAAGFVTGLGWGDNAKAAVMRVGLLEMTRFAQAFFPGRGVRPETFTEESAGVADLITSCSGGRNFRCARMAVEERKDIREIEKRELNGQILQGIGTAEEVHAILVARGKQDAFPLMDGVWKVLNGKARPEDLPELLEPTRLSHRDLTKL